MQKFSTSSQRDKAIQFPTSERDFLLIQKTQSGYALEEGEWIIVSGDPRISRGKAERQAWQESQLTAFFFGDGWTSRSYWKQAEDIVHWWPRIVLEAEKAPRGKGFLIHLGGKDFRVIYDPLAPAKTKR